MTIRFRLNIAALALALSAHGSLVAAESLTLDVQDAIAKPGGIAALVVRTYASRPIGQGQVCLKSSGRPFRSQEGLLVPDPVGDSLERSQIVDPRTVTVQMLSPSGSINSIEGPMFAVYFRVRNNLPAGRSFTLDIDPLNTFLRDAIGNVVVVEGRTGILKIRAPGSAIDIEAEGDRVRPGEVAELGLVTFEPIPLSAGQFGLRYDPAAADGPPEVRVLEAFGEAALQVDLSVPGLLRVAFQSADASLNRIPGRIIDVVLPTSADAPVGGQTLLVLDPDLTFLVDRQGRSLPLALEPGLLEFR